MELEVSIYLRWANVAKLRCCQYRSDFLIKPMIPAMHAHWPF